MDIQFLRKLDHVRDRINTPVILNSAMRCEIHNKEVKGEPDSLHLKGLAVDVSKVFIPDNTFQNKLYCRRFLYACAASGLHIIEYQSHFHVDLRKLPFFDFADEL
jgi:hypothetical protein